MTGVPSVSTSSYGLGGFGYTDQAQAASAGAPQQYSSGGYNTGYFNAANSVVGQPAATAAAAPPKKEKKGFFGKVFGAAKSLVKGATVGLGKAIVNTLKDPKKLLLAAGAVALSIAFPPAGIALAGIGVAMAGKAVVENGVVAAQAYASGNDELAEAALENVGTGIGAGALSVAGVRTAVGAAAAKGINNGAAGGLNVSGKLATKIQAQTANGGSIGTGTAIRASFSNTYQGVRTGLTNFRSGVSAARANGASTTQAFTQTARTSATNLAQSGRANLSTNVRALLDRNVSSNGVSRGADNAAINNQIAANQGRISTLQRVLKRSDISDDVRLAAQNKITKLENQNIGLGHSLSRNNLANQRSLAAHNKATAVGSADDAATSAAATTADDAANAATPSFSQRITALPQRARDAITSFRTRGTTGNVHLDQQIRTFLQNNPTAQRVGASRAGTLVNDFNTIRPGVLPAVGGLTPFDPLTGQLHDNALLAAIQRNPFLLAQ